MKRRMDKILDRAVNRTTAEVGVSLGDRSYDIIIGNGILDDCAKLIREKVGAGKCAIITDENVGALYLDKLAGQLKRTDMFAGSITVPAGERSKCFLELERVIGDLLDLEIERGDIVVALGGGVIGDLAGFAASILRRGVRIVQIPTSLLAQVDSSVGGKTGINTKHGKNLVGTFAQPSLVLADLGLLSTLPERQFASGYAEIVKYGLIDQPDFFAWLEDNRDKILAGDLDARAVAISQSCEAKARIVAADEREAGQRALLNLGHTFGHALEAWGGYSDRLLHGEGVSIGMVMAYRFSEELGLCPEGAAIRIERHLKSAGLPIMIADIAGDDKPDQATLMQHISQDKKVERGQVTLILARALGDAFVTKDIAHDRLSDFIGRQIMDSVEG